MDKRHRKRIETVQQLFSYIYRSNSHPTSAIQPILKKIDFIDSKISSAAPKYDIAKIAKVDLSILRLAVYELLVEKKQPTKVIINEAIELGKDLASAKSPAFINAVLGKLIDHE